jgi:predicted HTH transcriptional regulator
MLQWLAEGQELTSRQCEAEFGVSRPVTAGDFGLLVDLGLAEKLGAGRSTRYRLKARENR